MSLHETMKEGWYLIKTKARQEQRAVEHLENQGFDAYCPMMVSKGVDVKDEALFPGYLFLYLDMKDLGQYHKISSTRGVSDFVRFNRVERRLYADGRISVRDSDLQNLLPQPIPNGELIMKQIKEMIECLKADEGASAVSFNKGDTVTICNPLYEHLKATFVKGVSMNRGLVLIQYIREQRNAAGVIEKTETRPIKTLTVKLTDIQKVDEP